MHAYIMHIYIVLIIGFFFFFLIEPWAIFLLPGFSFADVAKAGTGSAIV